MERDAANAINIRPVSRAYAATRGTGNPATTFESTFTGATTGGALWTYLAPDGRALVIQMTPRRVLGDLQRSLGFVMPDHRFGPQTYAALNASLGLPAGYPLGRRSIERMLLALYHGNHGDVVLPTGNVSIYDPNAVPSREVTGGDTTFISRLEFRDGALITPTTGAPDVQQVATGALARPGVAANPVISTGSTTTTTTGVTGTQPTPVGPTGGGTQSNMVDPTGGQTGGGGGGSVGGSTTTNTTTNNTFYIGGVPPIGTTPGNTMGFAPGTGGGAGGGTGGGTTTPQTSNTVTPVGSRFVPAGARTLASGTSLGGVPFLVYQTVAGLIFLITISLDGTAVSSTSPLPTGSLLPNGASLDAALSLASVPIGARPNWQTLPVDEKCQFYLAHANDPGITVPAPCLAQVGLPTPLVMTPIPPPAKTTSGFKGSAIVLGVVGASLLAGYVAWAVDHRASRRQP